MKMFVFAKRTAKEILRDPLNIFFGLGFPLVVLGLLTAIQSNIPVPMFELDRLTPGVGVFGLSFMSLFSATLLAKDRESALLQRLYTTPIGPVDFILGYTIPMLPIALAQFVICYLFAVILGLKLSFSLTAALLGMIPIALFYISLGLVCGSLLNSKAVGGVCGALLTNLSAWLSGIWFDIELMGEGMNRIAELLPFVHAVELERALLAGNFEAVFPHLWWVLGYTAAAIAAAILLFFRQMKRT